MSLRALTRTNVFSFNTYKSAFSLQLDKQASCTLTSFNQTPTAAKIPQNRPANCSDFVPKGKINLSHNRILRIVQNAEDLLGYRLHRLNNSFLLDSLHGSSPKDTNGSASLFKDEANVILKSIEKLKGSEHPLLSYAKGVNSDNLEESNILTSSFQLRSMVVMLVVKLFKDFITLTETDSKTRDSVTAKQRRLAEITELIYSAHMLHRTVVEIPEDQLPTLGKVQVSSTSQIPSTKGSFMHHGNKIATLIGDLVLAKCSKGLSSLRNARVTELMSDSIADFTEAEFIANVAKNTLISQRTSCNYRSLDVVDNMRECKNGLILNYEKWLRRSSLSIGSLLKNSCFSSLVFESSSYEVCSLASKIGFKIGIALQAYKDFTIFGNEEILSQQLDWCTLPVIFHLEKQPNLIRTVVDNRQMYQEVRNSQYAATRTKETLLVLSEDAFSLLDNLSSPSPACELLKDLLSSLTES